MSPRERWQVFPDTETLARSAADFILNEAKAAIAAHGMFHFVLAGGRTPEAAYQRLRAANPEWNTWQIYFGDERCLPRDDPGRNDTLARRAWLDHVPIPTSNVHSIPAEDGAESGARRYAEILRRAPIFDLVLLGLGEDGHTASLFPGYPLGLAESRIDVLAVRSAPKPPPERVSLSAARLSRAQRVLFLVAGESKREAVKNWRSGADIPARHVSAAQGVDIFVDRAAWPEM